MGEQNLMYLLQIDPIHNRLNIRLSGNFDERQAAKLNADLMLRVNELMEGFHVLCDLTGLVKFERSARKHYSHFMDLCGKSGARKVIRILPDSHENFGLTIMSHFHYKNIPVVTCDNFDEALKHLRTNKTYNQIRKDNGPLTEKKWDISEEARSALNARIMRCTLGENPEDCPLHEVRKQPMKERKTWLGSKANEEVVKLYRQHIKCLDYKFSKTSKSPD